MPDSITTIENDHREIERLFDAYRSGPADEQQDVIDRIRMTLSHHAAAEEILVHPAVRHATDDGDE